MPKCSCAGSGCNCQIQVGEGLTLVGTGNASNPYVIGLVQQSAAPLAAPAGSADLSMIVSGTTVLLELTEPTTTLSLNDIAGTQIDLVVHHVAANTEVEWPTDIRWPGALPPTQTATAGSSDWYALRHVGDFWVGAVVASDIR